MRTLHPFKLTHYDLLRLTLFLLLITWGLGCHESEPTALNSSTEEIAPDDTENTTLEEIIAPNLRFGKQDTTDSAHLQDPLEWGKVRQGDTTLFQAIPVMLSSGDQVRFHLWSSDLSAFFVFAPEQSEGIWEEERSRSVSEAVKLGLMQKSVDFTASRSGKYLVAIGPVETTKIDYLFTIECTKGPCEDDLMETQARQAMTEGETFQSPTGSPE